MASARVLLVALPISVHTAFHGYVSSKESVPRVPVVESPTASELIANADLPSNFDWRNVNGESFTTVDLNQHIPLYCGSCWIHGTVHALNDRIKILRNRRYPDIVLSRQAIMNCVPPADGQGAPPGCNGGDAWMIHRYLHDHKLPDDTCMAYSGINMHCTPENVCRNCYHNQTTYPDGSVFFTPGPCFAVKHYTGYGVSEYGDVHGEKAMKEEIYARGPLACNFATDDRFVLNYSTNPGIIHDNVYTEDKAYLRTEIDHVMEVAGWGVSEKGTPYWVVRNSWGTYWGDKGWVKIRRGSDQQLVESGGCSWAMPDVDDINEELKHQVIGDYVQGIVKGKRSVAPAFEGWEAPVTLAAVDSPVATTVLSSIIGAAFGSIATHFAWQQARPRQFPLLG